MVGEALERSGASDQVWISAARCMEKSALIRIFIWKSANGTEIQR